MIAVAITLMINMTLAYINTDLASFERYTLCPVLGIIRASYPPFIGPFIVFCRLKVAETAD